MPDTMLNAAQTAEWLRGHDRFLLLTHIRPDGDTIGSAAGLCAGLRAIGKTAFLLPNPQLTESTMPYAAPYAAPEDFQPETVVSVDIAALSLLPENAKGYADRIDLAIDHHPSHEGFAARAIVRPEAAAAGEIVYHILCHLGPITPAMALPLYVAVSTDTGCFAYANTSADTHAIAAALIRTGIEIRPVNKAFFQTKSRKRLQLESDMLNRMELLDRERAVFLTIPLSLLERVQASEYDAEDLSALGPQIQGVDCAATFRELRPDVWKISLRTGPRVNATEVCGRLGGGGHAEAAGCTIEAPLEQAKHQLLDALMETVPDFNRA